MQLKIAIGSFFVEFSKLETQFIGMALRALSRDPLFVEHAENLLDFEARLKLLERMAFARGIAPSLLGELEALLLRARKLHELRHELGRQLGAIESRSMKPLAATARNVQSLKPRKADYAKLAEVANLGPDLADIEGYAAESVELQGALAVLSVKLDGDAGVVPMYGGI